MGVTLRRGRVQATTAFEALKARLNLHAVLPNLEDVVRDDPEMRALVSDARITVRFVVARGPSAYVRLCEGACVVREGSPGTDTATSPVVLFFASPAQLNRMFDGAGDPIPVWGFTHLGFLKGPFTQLTERMAYYLQPTDELLAHEGYLAMNTRLTLNTAAFAVPQLLDGDPDCAALRHAIGTGVVVLKVLPDGPAVSLEFGPGSGSGAGTARATKGELPSPDALVLLPGLRVANDFLNGKLDTFAAVARGDVQVWGRVDMVDALALVLDRVGKYLQPADAPAA